MREKLPAHNHFASLLNQDCRPLLQGIGLTHFCYNKFQNNSPSYKMLILDNDYINCVVEAFEKKLDLEITKNNFVIVQGETKKILWSAFGNNPLTNFLYSKGIAHGVTIYIPDGDDMEAFTFATSPDNVEILNLYMNSPHLLDQFILFFKEKMKKVCGKTTQLPQWTYQNNFKPIFQKEEETLSPSNKYFKDNIMLKKYDAVFKEKEARLTLRQIQLLSHLSQGKSYKETAVYMGLLPSTVITYAENIKHKFSLYSQSDLIKLLHANPLFESLGK